MKCIGGEVIEVADVYTRRLDEAKEIAPDIKTYLDFRKLLDEKDVDAVLIATPQHQHVLNFVPAIQAGKDVYQEKTMAFNPDHTRRMRKAVEASNRVVQIGIQSVSGPGFGPVAELRNQDRMGMITAIHTQMFRNEPYGGWKRPIPSDCDLQHVHWIDFQGEAPQHPWDPNRYINWRFFWEYSGGNVFENMVHQVGFWYKQLNLQIPRAVTLPAAITYAQIWKRRIPWMCRWISPKRSCLPGIRCSTMCIMAKPRTICSARRERVPETSGMA